MLRIAASHSSSPFFFNLALRRDGRIVAWGDPLYYSATNPPGTATNLVAAAAGYQHALGLRADGTVIAWGSGLMTNVPAAATNIVAIAAGYNHSVALRADGRVFTWGSGPTNAPASLTNLSCFAVAADQYHTAVLVGDGAPRFVDTLGSLVAYSNQLFTLNALAVGQPPLAYQWYFNGTPIPNATNATFTLPAALPADAGDYSVAVSNALGAISNLVARLEVQMQPMPPQIQTQPASQTVYAGDQVNFSVAATGVPEPVYQWQFNNTDLPGATNPVLSLPYAIPSQAGNYRVIVSNWLGVVTSAVATLTVNLPDYAVLTNLPGSTAIPQGCPFTIGVGTAGAGPISYTWYRNGEPVPYLVGPTIRFEGFYPVDAGEYRVAVSNAYGGSLSPPFRLLSTPLAVFGNSITTNLPFELTNAIAISAGSNHALALKADGTLVAWGSNQFVVWVGGSPAYVTNVTGAAKVPPGLSNVVAIAAGAHHNLALRRDGTVVAWGWNNGGQTNVPAGLSNVIGVAAGVAHSLALRADGTVVAWGTNDAGQLNVPGTATSVVAIACGHAHNLALRADGTVVAWGTSSGGPTNVPASATNVVAIAAGGSHSVALRTDGSRVAWGTSFATAIDWADPLVGVACAHNYELLITRSRGLAYYTSDYVSPIPSVIYTNPPWLKNPVAVAAGNAGKFVLMQPGTGLPVPQITERVAHLGGEAVFSALLPGRRFDNGYQWLRNGAPLTGATNAYLRLADLQPADAADYSVVVSNQWGVVTSSVTRLTLTMPPPPQLLSQPVSLTVGEGQTATFSVSVPYGLPLKFQWEFNGVALPGANAATLTLTNVQLTNAGEYRVVVTNWTGALTSQVATLNVTSVPTVIVTQPTGRAVVPGSTVILTFTATGTAPLSYQWLLDGTILPDATNASLVIPAFSETNIGDYRAVVSNAVGVVTSAVARLIASPAVVWGQNPLLRDAAPLGLSNVIALASGRGHALALCADGKVVAWGSNDCGQATVPAAASNVVRIAAGDLHSLALRDDGTVVAWGANSVGQCNVPSGLSNVVDVAGGCLHSVAVRADGRVVAWGANERGATNCPAHLSNVVAVAAAGFHNLALRKDGSLAAWGDMPTVPPEATNVVAISAGFGHCAALRADGSVVAWGSFSTTPGLNANVICSGYSISGSLSNVTALLPVPEEATNIVAIASGRFHLVALRADGTVLAWGDNSAGQCDVPAMDNVIGVAAGGLHSLALTGPPGPRLVSVRTNRTANAGFPLLLAGAAGGRPPVQLDWSRDGTNLVSAAPGCLFLPATQFEDAGACWLTASNAFGVASQFVTLSISSAPPTFVRQPSNWVGVVGQTIQLAGEIIGSPPLALQWLRDGAPLADDARIAGAQSPSLTIAEAQVADSGNYQLVATNSMGTVTSAVAVVTVLADEPLAVALDTTNLVWTTGGQSPWRWQSATNHDGVDAAQTGPTTGRETNWIETIVVGPTVISFWWKAAPGWTFDGLVFLVNGVDRLSRSRTFDWERRTWALGEGTNVVRWEVRWSNPFYDVSTAWLDDVGFGPGEPPVITSQPATNVVVSEGDSTSITVSVSGTEPFSYQWLFEGAPMVGATNSSLSLANVQQTSAGNYWVVVTNVAGAVTSQVATITVMPAAPKMTAGPTNQTSAPGMPVSFTSSFRGSPPIQLQWFYNDVPIPGATNATLAWTNYQPELAGRYRVVAANELGTTLSAEASLSTVPVAQAGYGPATVPEGLSDVIAVAAGYYVNHALRQDGTVVSWGKAMPPYTSNSTVALTSGAPIIQISATRGYNLLVNAALRNDGTVSAWGNFWPILNPSSLTANLTNVVEVASSGDGFFALQRTGDVSFRGRSSVGQSAVPDIVSNLVTIAASRSQFAGVREDGGVVTWPGSPPDPLTAPDPDNPFVAVSVGLQHTLALRADGSVVAWGDNSQGQTNVPAGLSDAVAIAAGTYHSVVLRANGTVVAWGANPDGRCGPWPNLTNVIAIAAGETHTLAVVGDGRPVFTVPPRRFRTELGGSATLAAAAVGAGPLEYQWYFNGTPIAGATNRFLRIPVAGLNAAGNYTVVASNPIGAVTSAPAPLILSAPVLRFDTAQGATFMAEDGLHMRLLGLSGAGPVAVFATTDFKTWETVFTNGPCLGALEVVDPGATNQPHRFYRAAEMALPPAPTLRFEQPTILQTATGKVFRARLTGLAGSGPITVFSSTNLLHWEALHTNAPVGGEWLFERLMPDKPAGQWYRAAEKR